MGSQLFHPACRQGLRTPRFAAVLAGLAAIILALFGASTAPAQLAGKGAITGTVSDQTGAVIPAAEVAATNNGNGITSTTRTTTTGAYIFSDLDPGIYTVTTTATGFTKLVQQNVHVNALETQTYNPALTVGASGAEVTVTAEPPQLETSNATLGATMENETYSELPIEMGAYGNADQRRATDFVYLMPGVQGNETNGNATTNTGVVNGSGSRGAVSDVYIDGIPFVRAGGNGDPRYVWTAISVDAVDQFQLQTSGYSAVYEGQGVMNYSVKQGTANLHGSVYEFFRNTALDTWGWFGKASNPATGVPVKPIEHSNEYGIAIGGPLIPFATIKQKLFFFTNYNGFRYTSATPTPMTFPTPAEQNGDFSALSTKIYDPLTQTTCTAHSTDGPCRYQFGYGPGIGSAPRGNPVLIGAKNVIPTSELSQVALNMQSFLSKLPSGAISNSLQNNYVSPNATGLVNWSTTSRIDYLFTPADTVTVLGAVGRQASSVPVGQTTAGRNIGPVPYNFGQAYAPKTAVWTVEETHVFSPHLLNQLKWGYARYNGPTFNPDDAPVYSATKMGLSGLPAGQAQTVFPIVTFTGANAPTNWGGTTENVTLAENYTLLDNMQWNVGSHSFTVGGQIAWLQYNVINATKGSTPITLANAVTETAGINPSSSNAYVATTGTGNAYASFLVGEIDKGSFTQYLQREFGARFLAVSPYVQDNWKVTSRLTLDLGLRYDFYPSVTEVHNAESFFDPALTNPVTGIKGALNFTGHSAGTCNCATPVNNYWQNIGPRLGLAYQLGSKTVIRSSYGVMYTHGNAVGGLNTSIGTLGFSSAPSFSANGQLLSTIPLHSSNGAIPSYATATGVASGPAYGTGYTNTSGYTGTPSSMTYNDPYLGGRAPQYINWTFGVQRQLNRAVVATVSYVGSEGHFLQTDDGNGRGYRNDQLDPKYLLLGKTLADTNKNGALSADCANNSLPCPSNFTSSQPLSTALKPFPFQSVSDNFGQYMGNSNYHALQALLSMRDWHGLTLSANYTFSRAIDDGGMFRSGYSIPAGTIANAPNASYKADRIERSVSTSNQPHHFVSTGVWKMPFGHTVFANGPIERAVLGGFTFSGVFQAYSGSPLVIQSATCQQNPAQGSKYCPAALNPSFTGSARQNGRWGHGADLANYSGSMGISYINANAFEVAPDYTFGNAPRTAAYNLYSPGNNQIDLAMVRSFPLHITEATKLDFRAEWYNVTNHTLFSVASTSIGNSSFGQITQSPNVFRKAAQFSARIKF